jgi:hypothetical protein
MLKTILTLLTLPQPKGNEMIRRAQGYYKIPNSFKEWVKLIKLRING